MTPTKQQLGSPRWRLANMYKIVAGDASGGGAGVIPFRPTAEQQELIDAIYIHKWEFIIVIKARQLGLSTVMCLIILDALLFGSSIQASIVDLTADNAQNKLEQKIRLAFNSLPDEFRSAWTVDGSNDSEFTIRLASKDKMANCTCFAGLRARGGTNHILFISEWGEIQTADKHRSVEILNGALPSAQHPGCVIVSETTWASGKSGELWPFVESWKEAVARNAPMSAKDPRVLFFGWHCGAKNRDDGPRELITEKTHAYCDGIEKVIGKPLDDAQRLWWQKQKAKYKIFMASQHPSTLAEALESPHSGSYFDPVGVTYQENCAIGLETRREFGIISVNEETKVAVWQDRPEEQAIFRMWDRPREGESYLLGADFCIGRQAEGASGDRDTNAYAVWRAEKVGVGGRLYPTQMVCACMPEDRCGTEETIRRIVAMHLYYGACMVVPEVNGKDNIAERLMAAGVRRMWTDRGGVDGSIPGTTRTTHVLGWLTTGNAGGTRRKMLDMLQELVMQQKFVGSCRTLANQLSMFVVNEKGVPAAASGHHDDWVMMTAISMYTMNAATPYMPIGLQSTQKAGVGDWREVITDAD